MKDVIYVPQLKKNLLSISALDAKEIRVSFVNGQDLMWPRGKIIEDAIVIGEEDGGLYKIKGLHKQALVHESIEPSELFHRSIAHVHYRALLMTSKVVLGFPEIQEKYEGI